MSNPRADQPASDMTIRENMAALIAAGVASNSVFDPRNTQALADMSIALADAIIDTINPVAPPP